MTAVDYRQQTTLLTGASAGIGVEFAHQLAARGPDLVLVARRRERLETLAHPRHHGHGRPGTDLSVPRAGQRLANKIAEHGLTVTSVINCAGFGTFHAEDVGRLHDEISVDLTNVVDIFRAFIEPLRAAGTGVLINVASMAAYQPNPNMAVYGGTKAFVLNFTEALWQESQGTGLRVLALSPGATKTEFFDDVGNNASGGVRMQTRSRSSTPPFRHWTVARRRLASPWVTPTGSSSS